MLLILVLVHNSWSDQSVLKGLEKDIHALLAKTEKSVVTVHIQGPQTSGKTASVQTVTGVIFKQHYVVIKSPNITASSLLSIDLSDGRSIKATFLGSDALLGIAVLRTFDVELISVTLRANNNISAGSWVLVVGNSLGVPNAASLGLVNCVRSDGIIQIAGNVPATSLGSPIFNSDGELVGLLSALINPQPWEINADPTIVMGDMLLAEPIERIIERVEEIISEADQPWVGIGADTWPGHIGGAHIRQIVPGSPASKSDLQVGDIILGIEGKKWNRTQQIADFIRGKKPGDSVEFEILRGAETVTRTIQIGSRGAKHIAAESPVSPGYERLKATDLPSNSQIEREIKALQQQLNKLKMELGNR